MRQFITKYLVSGPKITPFAHEQTDTNQIRYEQYLRSIIAEKHTLPPQGQVSLGAVSELDMPWEFYDSPGDYFLSIKQFSYTLTKTEVLAACCLRAEKSVSIPMALWSYGAVEIWLRDTCICRMDAPQYKPMKRIPFTAVLEEGDNLFLLRMTCLGARDTRNMLGLERLDNEAGVTCILPHGDHSVFYENGQAYLASIRLEGDTLLLPPMPVSQYPAHGADSAADSTREETRLFFIPQGNGEFIHGSLTPDEQTRAVDLTGRRSYDIPENDPHISLVLCSGSHSVRRNLERINHIVPDIETKQDPYAVLSQSCEGDHFEGKRLNLLYWLAGRALNRPVKFQLECLDQALEEIQRRADCSDFYMAALLRHIRCYGLPQQMKDRAKEAILHYRYWMTENGSDGMCFWSENHSLLFFIDAYMAGQLFPEDTFLRSGRTGLEQSRWALSCIRQWLRDVVEYGFDEFLSADYMCVTMGALLNVVDFAPEEESAQASALLDRLFHSFACHCFQGEIIAPQGRIYRSVLYPYTQNAQALMYLLDPDCPMALSEWLSFLLTSKYQLPREEKKWFRENLDMAYSSSNARIHLYKTQDYILTSVQSPRTDGGSMWSPVPQEILEDTSLDTLVIRNKAMNECFHGTSHFQPGVYGYQQHMCYAALDREAVVFVNHPGETSDLSSMRPGYWYGNGLMPAMKQEKNFLGFIYQLNDRHPVDFIHFFFPQCKFDAWSYDGSWLFASKGTSYLGIWCSAPLVPWNDLLVDCEFRAYGTANGASDNAADITGQDADSAGGTPNGSIASFWVLGRQETANSPDGQDAYASMEAFMEACRSLKPQFSGSVLAVKLADIRNLHETEAFTLTYQEYDDPSQYV